LKYFVFEFLIIDQISFGNNICISQRYTIKVDLMAITGMSVAASVNGVWKSGCGENVERLFDVVVLVRQDGSRNRMEKTTEGERYLG
jgi:hypothetical protein